MKTFSMTPGLSARFICLVLLPLCQVLYENYQILLVKESLKIYNNFSAIFSRCAPFNWSCSELLYIFYLALLKVRENIYLSVKGFSPSGLIQDTKRLYSFLTTSTSNINGFWFSIPCRWNYNVRRPSSVWSGLYSRGVHNIHCVNSHWVTDGGADHTHMALAHVAGWSH